MQEVFLTNLTLKMNQSPLCNLASFDTVAVFQMAPALLTLIQAFFGI
jgi:hypothetical protein